MIAFVASTVLPALFIGSGVFAAAVLTGTWRRYAGAYRRLSVELAGCDSLCTVTFAVARADLRPVAASLRPARRTMRSAVGARPGAMLPALCAAA